MINNDTLEMLPIDSHLTNLASVTLPSTEVEFSTEHDDSSYSSAHLQSTFIPASARNFTEQETIEQSIIDQQATRHHINWPSTAGNPINEFTTEGYIICAFPTLFAEGKADFLGPRQQVLTIASYFKHLILYHDKRFANHPRFRYFALNTLMRHRALQIGRIYVRQNPHNGHLTIDELRDMVGYGSDRLSNRVLHFGATLQGTRQFWRKQKTRLTAMVDTLGLPTVFFTLSAADLQWPELANLLDVGETEDSAARSRADVENPCMADWFFFEVYGYLFCGYLEGQGLLATI